MKSATCFKLRWTGKGKLGTGTAAGLLAASLVVAVAFAGLLPSTTPRPGVAPAFSGAGLDGQLDDTLCNVEQVERANVEQLHSLLKELTNTTFFRLFRVSIDRPCPFWGPDQKAGTCGAPADPDPAASSPFAGSPVPQVGRPGSQCTVETTSSPSGSSAGPFQRERLRREATTDPVDGTRSEREVAATDLAESARAACSDENVPDFWLDMCDSIVEFAGPDGEGAGTGGGAGGAPQFVNLVKNPERWTGYNGSHIWAAIYQENCFSRAGDFEHMCYEERVLYRLLSGMHASTSVAICRNFFPPQRGKRADWEPNPARYMEIFATHPERLKNLHFAFVVMLRALHRAAPHLVHVRYDTGDAEEEARTTMLMRRLLESRILQSCGPVFSAFDESLLFRPRPDQNSAAAVLKRQFKGVFRNISRVIDCVSCQKCRLHAKLQLLGLGTALQVLLLPEHLIPASLSRDGIVALVNTVARFSESITESRHLAMLHWQSFKEKQQLLGQASGADDASAWQPGTGGAASAAASSGSGPTAGPGTGSSSSSSAAGGGGRGGDLGGGSSWQLGGTSGSGSGSGSADVWGGVPRLEEVVLVDSAVGLASRLARTGALQPAQEDAVVDLALLRDAGLLALVRQYGDRPDAFVRHLLRNLDALIHRQVQLGSPVAPAVGPPPPEFDAVVVGCGLAGLTAAVSMLDRGARVVMLEKEPFMGGNSAWASSGLNAVGLVAAAARPGTADLGASPPAPGDAPDSVELFANDTLKSGGMNSSVLVSALARDSWAALQWLRNRTGLALDQVSQLGGHSRARTYRPSEGMAGSKLIFALQAIADRFVKSGQLEVRKRSRAVRLLKSDDGRAVVGVEYEVSSRDEGAAPRLERAMAPSVMLATGGYASDSSPGSLLVQQRPDLAGLPTTNGRWSVGEGVRMAIEAGAATVDLDQVQIHPTAFVDPRHPDANRKTLCAELLRGVGGLLLDRGGRRFANELGTRSYLTGRMFESDSLPGRAFWLVLNERAADAAASHVSLYMQKGLLNRFDSLAEAAERLAVPARVLAATFRDVNAATMGDVPDPHGRTSFEGGAYPTDDGDGPLYAGMVAPALHYTMGGLAIDPSGRVLAPAPASSKADGGTAGPSLVPLPGLFAAGEVSGGVHGHNRLAGNALTECVVFGRAAGLTMPVARRDRGAAGAGAGTGTGTGTGTGGGSRRGSADAPAATVSPAALSRRVSRAELAEHASEDDCWMALFGKVYDFTDFLEEHPGGSLAVLEFAGRDGSEKFKAVHNLEMLDGFEPLGTYVG